MLPAPANPLKTMNSFQNSLFSLRHDDYELYEEDGEFVLTIEMPGFDREDITVSWDTGVLNISAENTDDVRGTKRTYHRRYRFPRDVNEEEIAAQYNNGILTVTLPVRDQVPVSGTEIEIED